MIYVTAASLLAMGLKKAIDKVNEKDENTPINELSETALRAEIKANALIVQAKVEQELAISRRIDSAEEVEIEEHYDLSAKGNVGLNSTNDQFAFGIGGEGRKVTKRIIKFKGCTPIVQDYESQE